MFYYFGDDEAYFRTLMGEFKKHTRLPIEFKKISETDEKRIQSLFLKVYTDQPKCVFIDFSKKSQDYLHLARLLVRTPTEADFCTVGLVDYLSPPEILVESIATGVDLTHIKSAETFDVVFDVVKLIAPNEIGEHGFATATLKESVEAGIPVKVGYVHSEGIHFETSYPLQKGDRIKINHHWLQKKVVPSKEMFVKEVSRKNLFYHFKYAVDADFLFVDEFLPPEGMDEATVDEKRKEREELIIYHKKQLSKWLEDNATRSHEKKAKVLIVDREFHFFNNQQRTDKHPYTIRCVPFIDKVEEELDRLEPQVIAFALEKPDSTSPINTNEKLVNLVNGVKQKYQGEEPFIIVFNADISSKELQENFKYQHIMGTNSELSVDVLLRMAEIFEKKLEDNLIKPKARGPEKVFLQKTNSASIAELIIPVDIIKLSESNMIFQTETPLPENINLHFLAPVNMYANVQPSKGQSKVPEYHGLIHSIGEDHKKELRRFVNSVFFREHDAKNQAETDEFKKLNEAKFQEKEALLKAQMKEAQEAEEAAKAAEEAAKTPEEKAPEPEPEA